jgi:hypothetical protein
MRINRQGGRQNVCGGMTGDTKRSVTAQNLLAMRGVRQDDFPSEIFDEFAWNMLLILFVSLARNEVITEATLIQRSGAPVHAGQRWITHLIKDNQISKPFGDDVVLTNLAIDKMRRFLDRAEQLVRRTTADC